MKFVGLGLAALMLAAASGATANPQSKAFIKNFDANGDGEITMAEAESHREQVFSLLDRDRSDSLSREELVRRIRMVEQVLSENEIDKKASSDSIDAMIAQYDKDSDSEISLAEYNNGIKGWFKRKDRNGDGVISAADARKAG
ncbi:MAG: EF-hand domain-containing protein [Rhodovulum sp.]|jgi:Ca2+-binding EF-hand superfamily protein|nr:hypothetical protein [Rhodovulum sp.]MCI5085125.1 EF-hand domain-containing protein [Rhodovulum sp.]|tara:strand:- start:2591 stop:3019 length:429 start_codon:yes stop_codon:yes gene_type:complete